MGFRAYRVEGSGFRVQGFGFRDLGGFGCRVNATPFFQNPPARAFKVKIPSIISIKLRGLSKAERSRVATNGYEYRLTTRNYPRV